MIKLTAREEEILNVLEVFGYDTRVEDIACMCECSSKNVSSYLTYLRNKGYNIPKHNKAKSVKSAKIVDNSWLDKYAGTWAN